MEWLLGGGSLLFGAAFVAMAFLNRKDNRETLAARDLLDGEREELRKVRGELNVETAAHAETRRLLAKEKDLRAVAESQRNQAFQEARDYLVAKLKKSKIADVERFIADLLATPLPGLPEAVPASRATTPGPDALIDPFAVQPSGDSGADR